MRGMFRGGKIRKDIPKGDVSSEFREIMDMYNDPRRVFDKTEFVRRRSRLVDLQQSKNGEISGAATRLKDALEADVESFGYGPIRQAKREYAIAKENESKFLNRNSGDMKIATEARLSRIGTEKPLSKQEMDHLKELERYLGHPITKDAEGINKLNFGRSRLKKIKEKAGYGLAGAVAGGIGVKKFIDH